MLPIYALAHVGPLHNVSRNCRASSTLNSWSSSPGIFLQPRIMCRFFLCSVGEHEALRLAVPLQSPLSRRQRAVQKGLARPLGKDDKCNSRFFRWNDTEQNSTDRRKDDMRESRNVVKFFPSRRNYQWSRQVLSGLPAHPLV